MSDDISIEELNKQTRRELDFQVKESKNCIACKHLGELCYGHKTRITMLKESLGYKRNTETQDGSTKT